MDKKYQDSTEYQNAKARYDNVVANNIKDNLCPEKYTDPDKTSQYYVEINNLNIYLSQDGLCGYKEIARYSTNITEDYKLLREGMFDCLVWPAYAMSINQMRYSKYKDRVDLLLIDIKKFFDIVENKKVLNPELAQTIMNHCDLGRAYIFPHTFYWLLSFNSFQSFIAKRNLKAFVSDVSDITKWVEGASFSEEYYHELLKRVKTYKNG